jgi:hypothetical protein
MRRACLTVIVLLVAAGTAGPAWSWSAEGHKTVGAIADQLLHGTHAGTEVSTLLGGGHLQDAAVWPDCAKGVVTKNGKYVYAPKGSFAECKRYETKRGKAAMVDFVRRNSTSCAVGKGDDVCRHKEYHYSDISVAHDHYDKSFVGARNDDIVGAISAAVVVLQGGTATAPFSFKGKQEALRALAHYVGDVHQPLHVAAEYLDATGKPVDPDAGSLDAKTETRGGNSIDVQGSSRNLHATWDAIPAALTADHVTDLLGDAKAVAATSGAVDQWPTAWASESVKQAQDAFSGIKFSSRTAGGRWTATVPPNYSTTSTQTKRTQLERGGARLAAILTTVWP